MKAAPGGVSPDPRQSSRIHRSIDEEYAHADRLRASLLAGVFLTSAAALGLLWLLSTWSGAPLEPWQRRGLTAGAITGAALGCLELLLRSHAGRARSGRGRILVWYGSTVLEIGTITAAWLLAGGPEIPMAYLSPGIAGFASLTVLSALRLDWRITAFTGMLSAISSAALRLHLWDDPAGHGPGPLGSVGPLVLIGILTALVAEQARRRTFHAIEAIAAQQRLEREVTRMAETERHRIGQDLHDGLGSRLRGLALMAQGLARRVQGGHAAGADELGELADLLGDGVDEVRRLARGLAPAPVEAGLSQALQGLADRTEAAGTSCTFLVEGDGELVVVDHDTTLHLYHIAQEAVTNAIRHGQAPHVDIRLTVRATTIALDVRDDGSGIAAEHVEGMGLRTMRQRAALLDAILRVRGGPEGSTLVTCVVPREAAPAR